MDLVLVGLTWEVCLVYLDDIIVMAHTFERHLDRLETAESRSKVKSGDMQVISVKSQVPWTRRERKRNRTYPEKVQAVVNWSTPRNLTEARGFVALASYYRRFIRFFADIARSIHLLIRENQPFV